MLAGRRDTNPAGGCRLPLQFRRFMFRRLRQLFCVHCVHLYKANLESSLRRAADGMTEADCEKCGKRLRASCGLALPGFRLGISSR